MMHTVEATAAGEIASDALDTLLALMKHRADCRQCAIDEQWCAPAGTYQRQFMAGVRRYERSKQR